MKKPYQPKDEPGKQAWLANLNAKLGSYQTELGLSDGDIDGLAADAAYFSYVLQCQQQVLAYGQQWTAYKIAARSGRGLSLGAPPAALGFGTAPTAVAPGIFLRAAALVARIKAAPGYTDAIGEALGIIGAESTVDLTSLKPILTATLDAGQIIVGWTKQGMDGVEILVDRGTGFAFLALDTVPDYTDTQTFPASGVWKYKAIYRLHDERVGQWSDVISLAVAA